MQHNKLTRALAGVAATAISLGCFAFGAGTAQAADTDATITLSGSVAGHTFKAYQLASFEKVRTDGTDKKDITSLDLVTNAAKADLIKTTAEAVAAEEGGIGDDKATTVPAIYAGNPAAWLSTWPSDGSALRKFVEAYVASADLGDPSQTVTGAEGDTSVELNFGNVAADAGWFVVTDTDANGKTLGSPVLVGSTYATYATLNGQKLGEATVKPSEQEEEVAAPTKTVEEKSVTVSRDGKYNYLHYTVTGKLPSKAVAAGYTYQFVDVPQAGLTLVPRELAVEVQDTNDDGTLKTDADGNPVYVKLTVANYTAPRRQTVGDGAATFTIALKNVDKLPAGASVRVSYQGYVTAATYNDAGIAEVSNAVTIQYGADATALKATAAAAAAVKVYKGIAFTKIGADTKQGLAGAQFTLTAKGTGTQIGTATSAADGSVVFEGLAAGTYTVAEYVVPAGYYENVKPSFDVTINEDGTVAFGRDGVWDLVDTTAKTVTNVNKVTQLPSTGGAGLAFIMAAIVLAASGSVFFAAKYTRNRRMTRA